VAAASTARPWVKLGSFPGPDEPVPLRGPASPVPSPRPRPRPGDRGPRLTHRQVTRAHTCQRLEPQGSTHRGQATVRRAAVQRRADAGAGRARRASCLARTMSGSRASGGSGSSRQRAGRRRLLMRICFIGGPFCPVPGLEVRMGSGGSRPAISEGRAAKSSRPAPARAAPADRDRPAHARAAPARRPPGLPRCRWSLAWPERHQHPQLELLLQRAVRAGRREGWLTYDPRHDWLPDTDLAELHGQPADEPKRRGLPAGLGDDR
jgi:hypothetical protein